MYFSGNISIAPSQIKHIKRVMPERAFKRILYFMTFGAVSDRIEQETFTAVSILQQLYASFNSLGINNLIRLSHDSIDFYLDSDGKHDDLKETLDRYDLETNEAMSKIFNQLQLVLEHREGSFHYLINITVNRNHAIGAHPIDIHIDGLIDEFKGSDATSVKERMQTIFKSQKSYDAFMRTMQAEFDQFLGKITIALAKKIRIKKVKAKQKSKIIVPKKVPGNAQAVQQRRWQPQTYYSPLYHGYYGIGDALLYALLWADMCRGQHIHIHDTTLTSEDNLPLMSVGAEGIAADSTALLNTDVPYEQRLEESQVTEQPDTKPIESTDSTDVRSWFGGDSSYSSSSNHSSNHNNSHDTSGGNNEAGNCSTNSNCSSSNCNSSSCSTSSSCSSSSCSSSSCSSSSCSSCSS